MGDEYQGRTFKSGNSVALRLPKGLGVPEGVEVRMVRERRCPFASSRSRHRAGNSISRRSRVRRPGFGRLEPEDRIFEDRPLRSRGIAMHEA